MFRFCLLFVLMLLTACSQIYPEIHKRIVPRDQKAFSHAFDSFRQSHQIAWLQTFQQNYPDSEWAQRAATIIFYAEKVDQAKAQLERQNLELEALKLDNESLADQLIQLEQGNQELTEQLEQLKGLLIQLEQRSQQDG